MRRFTDPERRARLGVRHRLAPGTAAPDPVTAVDDLVAVHATDPASMHLAVLARTAGATVADVGRALYDDRTLLRLLGMRRTVFVAPTATAGVIQAACGRTVAAVERRKLVDLVVAGGLAGGDDVGGWLAAAGDALVAAVDRRGEATAAELVADDPRLAVPLDRDGVTQSLGSRLLFVLAAEGRLVRARPRGSWTSQQHRWATTAAWCGAGWAEPPVGDAELELARRWLHAHGPATVADLAWWTGWTLTRTRRTLARLGPVAVELADGVPGVVLPDDVDPVPTPAPGAALLPALDPTAMGWKHRDWYLGGHGPALLDRTGNLGPTLWWDGAVIGGWVRRGSGEIVWRLLADVGAEAGAAIAAAARRLEPVVADATLAPRGRRRCPLEQELLAGL